MKNVTFIATMLVVATLTLASCGTSPQKQAEKAVTEYVKSKLKNPDSYKSISFDTVDSTFTSYKLSDEGAKLLTALDSLKQEHTGDSLLFELNKSLNMAEEEALYAVKMQESKGKVDALKSTYSANEAAFKSEFNGWYISHKYKASNSLGAEVQETANAMLNKDFSIYYVSM